MGHTHILKQTVLVVTWKSGTHFFLTTFHNWQIKYEINIFWNFTFQKNQKDSYKTTMEKIQTFQYHFHKFREKNDTMVSYKNQ